MASKGINDNDVSDITKKFECEFRLPIVVFDLWHEAMR